MIEISQITVTPGEESILNELSLTIEKGEILGIIGTPGAGKTVLLKTIAGIQPLQTGEITINGKPLRSFSTKDFHRTVSMMGNYGNENPDDTVFNFTLLSRTPYKKLLSPFSDYDLQVTENFLERFNLERYRNRTLGTLSQSTLQQVRIAHAFIREAPLLLLDNPTALLNIAMISPLKKNLLKYVLDGDNTVLVSSNDINFLLHVSDRIILLHEGSIVEEGPPESIDAELIKKYFNIEVLISRNIYNGKPEVHFFPDI